MVWKALTVKPKIVIMETLAAVLLYLEAINGDNSYTFEKIESVEDAHQSQVESVYNDESELNEAEEKYADDVEVDQNDNGDDMVHIGPLTTDDGNSAY